MKTYRWHILLYGLMMTESQVMAKIKKEGSDELMSSCPSVEIPAEYYAYLGEAIDERSSTYIYFGVTAEDYEESYKGAHELGEELRAMFPHAKDDIDWILRR